MGGTKTPEKFPTHRLEKRSCQERGERAWELGGMRPGNRNTSFQNGKFYTAAW